jgi:hypothetical protein
MFIPLSWRLIRVGGRQGEQGSEASEASEASELDVIGYVYLWGIESLYTRGNHERVVPAPLWQQNLEFYVICLLTVLFTTSYGHPRLELPPSSALASI